MTRTDDLPRVSEQETAMATYRGIAWCVATQAPVWVLIVLIALKVVAR